MTEINGLQLLDITTEIECEKITRNVNAIHVKSGLALQGYEIHMGQSVGLDCLRPAILINDKNDGAMSSDGLIWGTYLHGLFQADSFRRHFIEALGARADRSKYFDKLNASLDKISIALENVIDVDSLFALARS